MKKNVFLMVMLGMVLAFGLVFVGCDDGGSGGGGGVEELLEVNHVNGFQGVLPDGSLIEIDIASVTPNIIPDGTQRRTLFAENQSFSFSDGNQSFTLYINGVISGTGTLTLSSGSITAILSCTNTSLTYSSGVRYSGNSISLRPADNKVWVHWVAYVGGTMNDFNTFAQTYNGDANQMYANRPSSDDQGYYSYDTPQNIYNQACVDYPDFAPPISALNQGIRVLNDRKNTGVGAYVSSGYIYGQRVGLLIAYYFKRVQ